MVHRITSDDLWSLKALGDIALSPDGRRVAFVTQSSDREKDRSRSAISLLHLDEYGHPIVATCSFCRIAGVTIVSSG